MVAMIPSPWMPLALLCAGLAGGSSDLGGANAASRPPLSPAVFLRAALSGSAFSGSAFSGAALSTAPLWQASPLPATSPSTSSAVDEHFRFDRYHGCAEIEARFRALAADDPRWFRAASLGSSVEGRSIPILMVTDFASLADEAERPGFWIDGSIHGGELETTEVVLRVAEELRTHIASGRAPEFLSRTSLYLVPVLNPDGRTRALASPPKPGRLNSAEDGGADLNRDFPARWDAKHARLASDSQPESAAVMNFWRAHPNICLAASFHTSVNGFLQPPLPMSRGCRARYQEIATLYREQLAIDSLAVPTHARGTTMDWFFAARRCIAFTIEFEGAYRPDTPLEERSARRTRRFLSNELDPLTARHAAVLLQLASTLAK